jgi:membrane-associated phospholipid phosphatase
MDQPTKHRQSSAPSKLASGRCDRNGAEAMAAHMFRQSNRQTLSGTDRAADLSVPYDGCGYAAGVASRRFRIRAVAVALVCGAIFASLAEDVRDHERWSLDRTLLLDLHRYHARGVMDAWLVVTQLGSYLVTGAAAVLVGVWLGRRRGEPATATLVVASVGGAMLLGVIAKAVFQRPRPHLWPSATPTLGYSFPSAHAMNSIALVAVLVVITPARRRGPVAAAGAAAVVLIGLSRVWLGAHYPTGIVAGWALALAWTLSLAAALFSWGRRRGVSRVGRRASGHESSATG